MLVSALTLAGLVMLAESPSARVDFRVAAGEEWDTNARRVISTGNVAILENASLPSGPVVGDGLTRFLADTQAAFHLAEAQELQLRYVLGGKRFYQYGSEDQLVHDLSFNSQHGLADWLALSSWGSLKVSRVRSGTRDYSFGTAGLGSYFYPSELVTLGLSGGFLGFDFRPEHRLSYVGPTIGGEVSFRPIQRMTFTLRVDESFRNFDGNALVRGTDSTGTQIVTFCDGSDGITMCTPVARRDHETAVALRGAYRGAFVVGAEYLLRVQRSSTDLEDIDRHRLSAFATFPLPFELTGNVLGALQINSGVSVTDTKFLAEDDENQNSVQAEIRRNLSDALSIHLRYALFANQFSTAPVSFFRQTVYLGVSYRIGSS